MSTSASSITSGWCLYYDRCVFSVQTQLTRLPSPARRSVRVPDDHAWCNAGRFNGGLVSLPDAPCTTSATQRRLCSSAAALLSATSRRAVGGARDPAPLASRGAFGLVRGCRYLLHPLGGFAAGFRDPTLTVSAPPPLLGAAESGAEHDRREHPRGARLVGHADQGCWLALGIRPLVKGVLIAQFYGESLFRRQRADGPRADLPAGTRVPLGRRARRPRLGLDPVVAS